MSGARLTRRRVLQTAAMTTGSLAAPFLWRVGTANAAAPSGKMVLAWHTNITARWLDPQQHDGTASPDNFLMALHDALIKNFREARYDHPALAEGFEFAEDAKSATFPVARRGPSSTTARRSRPTTSNGATSTIAAPGARCSTSRPKGSRSSTTDTVRFHFKEPFLDFPILLGTGNVSGAGWVVPAKYYEKVGPGRVHAEADRRRPLQARLAGTGDAARIRGVRRLLPPGAHQEAHDGQRAGGGDARRDARARRSGHHRISSPAS